MCLAFDTFRCDVSSCTGRGGTVLAKKYYILGGTHLGDTAQCKVEVSLRCLSRNVAWQSDCKKKTTSAAQRSCRDLITLDSKLVHLKASFSVKKIISY